MYTQSKPIEQFVKSDIFNSLEIPVIHNQFQDCLIDYFKIDSISDWKDKDGKKKELIKSSLIYRLPKNMCFVLRQPYFRKKSVSIPLEIDLKSFCVINSKLKNYKYSIYGIVIHTGSHYFTYIFKYNKWIKYDDDEVHTVNYREIVSNPPYMLFYKQIQI